MNLNELFAEFKGKNDSVIYSGHRIFVEYKQERKQFYFCTNNDTKQRYPFILLKRSDNWFVLTHKELRINKNILPDETFKDVILKVEEEIIYIMNLFKFNDGYFN